ncbi:hypothetical protein QUF90_13780 [Desulfococcaceae bacterium HSG9]|nr:hypothetical protein [Desulfococcaceae bacterium HSG9]
MRNNIVDCLEIGGEFHWTGVPPSPFLSWPSLHVFFALGRDALLAIWRMKKYKNTIKNHLFVPDYFCSEVTQFWKKKGIKVQQYEDDPRWIHPKWKTLNPVEGDFVLAVNYFGVYDGNIWREWRKKTHLSLQRHLEINCLKL